MIIRPVKKRLLFSYLSYYFFGSLFFTLMLLLGNATSLIGINRDGIISELSTLLGTHNVFVLFVIPFLIVLLLLLPLFLKKYRQALCPIEITNKEVVLPTGSFALSDISIVFRTNLFFDRLFNTATLNIYTTKKEFALAGVLQKEMYWLKDLGVTTTFEKFSLKTWGFWKKLYWMTGIYIICVVFVSFLLGMNFRDILTFFGIVYLVLIGGLLFSYAAKKSYRS